MKQTCNQCGAAATTYKLIGRKQQKSPRCAPCKAGTRPSWITKSERKVRAWAR